MQREILPQPAGRRRLRRQQEPRHHDPRRLTTRRGRTPRARTPSLQARRPIQGFQEIQAAFAGGKGDYHALQLKVERRYTRGLYLLNSFTWSRARDNASGHLEVQNGDNSRVNYRDLDGEFGRSGYDQPLNNTTSVVWELPFGKGRRWAANMNPVLEGVARRLAGRRHQHHDERRADQPVVLADGGVQVSAAPTYRPNLTGDPMTPSGSRRSTTI